MAKPWLDRAQGQTMVADVIPKAQFPVLEELSRQSELLTDFLRYPPDGPGV
jgi:hypothetical protein